MEHNANSIRPEAATDEPASSVHPAAAEPDCALVAANDPRFGSLAEENAWWEGLTHGMRCAARPAAKLGEAAAAAGEASLISARLVEAYRPLETDARGRAIRHDGFTPEAQRLFLETLAACGVVTDAARAAGIHKDTAYALRNRPEGRAFALAWQAAILISRGRMSDELLSRALNGVVTRIYRGGELWGERHHHDNRLAMAILTRLDREADGLGKGAAVANAIARDWDRFLGIVAAGGEETEGFLEAAVQARPEAEGAAELKSAAREIRRQRTIRLHAEGRADEIPTADLNPARMDCWSEDQWLRAELSGFLKALPQEAWPEFARDELEAILGRNRRSRRVYLAHFPAAAAPDRDPCDVWEDEDEDASRTNYPPPDGFTGYESGPWEDENYERELTPEEQTVRDADRAAERKAEVAAMADERAAAAHARDLYFGFTPTAPGLEPGAARVQARAAIREGDAE